MEKASMITEKVKSFQDACLLLQIEGDAEAAIYRENDKSVKAFVKLIAICRALNEGWTPDWTNRNEYKYYPWFEYSKGPAGVAARSSNYVFGVADSNFVSQLCFKSRELAIYAGTQFIDLYNDYLLG